MNICNKILSDSLKIYIIISLIENNKDKMQVHTVTIIIILVMIN